jgi:putative nucleotidyltransferase with HDIG domain
VSARRGQPPRLVARALVASFLTVVLILIAVFVLLSLDVRQRVRRSVADNLEAAQQLFAELESRREQDMIATVSTLAESPTLKAALDTWQAERRDGGLFVGVAVSTVQNEAHKIAMRIGTDVLLVVDARGSVVASAGPRAPAFAPGSALETLASQSDNGDTVVVTAAGPFRMMEVPLEVVGATIGSLVLGTALDAAYAKRLAALARADSAIVIGNRVWATTLGADMAEALSRYASVLDGSPAPSSAEGSAVVTLGGESWALRHVNSVGPAAFFALASIDAAARDATRAALAGLLWIAIASLALGGFGSFWLARTLTRPIDQLSGSLTAMATARHFNVQVPATGTSRELDALTNTFNMLIQSLAQAEAETQAAYLGAIRALAAALDARDPYTAGHSERVSALSVEMGRALELDDVELGTLRLGALLHDIGKIGVPDDVLRKESALTATEFALIRAHPVIGARILRSIPFLAPHLPIVELHHERPDGQGYPYGLMGDAIPLAARIVHAADAYDAMTSARAYRPGRSPHEALNELHRCIGTDFDRAAVEALVRALPRLPAASAGFDPAAFQWFASPRLSSSLR